MAKAEPRPFYGRSDAYRERRMDDVVRSLQRSSGIVENVCEHGIGHPTRESAEAIAKKYGHDIDTWLTHGCDGCCEKWSARRK